jgi:glutathione synthase/RimK-type ligase-like ATP-grasp enzyme
MSQVYIVVRNRDDWAPYYPSERVITFQEYLSLNTQSQQRIRLINLCDDFDYLSDGYYCSLMAEARGHHVVPSIRVLNDLSQPLLYQLHLSSLSPALEKLLKKQDKTATIEIKSYFGIADVSDYQPVARLLFERFPCPILEFKLRFTDRWDVCDISILHHQQLNDSEQTDFANALDYFSRKVWREYKSKKPPRYDLAILTNPEERLPPSNSAAIKKFIQAGKQLGMNVECIGPHDIMRLPEFDGLFIRETTAIDHHTYRFAKKAEAESMVVLDDPTSILRCTNKVYLAKLFEIHQVPTPATAILQRDHPEQLEQVINQLGLPLVIKIPDGSFSRGVVKVKTAEELHQQAAELFKQSSLILAQEFLYTEFDWRIGVLNNKAIYACRYYMVKNHWQIYRHGNNQRTASGGFETLPTFEVPKYILQAALKATKPIGNGLYGVDVKEANGKGYVIEVNDNPSIDSGVEDKYLGPELYTLIMQEFIQRIEARRTG